MADFQVISKAKEMSFFIMKTTSNCNRFPKKWRFSLVDKMQNTSMEVYALLLEANREKDIRQRKELQTKSIMKCDLLLYYIEMCLSLEILTGSSLEYWTDMVSSVKYMTIAWRTGTR